MQEKNEGGPTTAPARHQILELIQAGRHADAVNALQSVCAAAPGNAEARYLLGCSQARIGRFGDACTSLQHSIRLQPGMAESHSALGSVLLELGRIDEAAACFNNALQIDASHAGAQLALAKIDIQREDFPAAEKRLRECLKVDSIHGHARFQLARLEKERGNHLLALHHADKVLELEPGSVNALLLRAMELRNVGRSAEAEESYKRALEIDPASLDALSGLALVYEYTGRYQQIVDLLASLDPYDQPHAGLAIVRGRICKQTGRCEEAVDYIEACLENPDTPRSTRMTLHFTAGKILDRLERYEDAFAHYRAGNDLVTHLYDAVGNAQLVNNLIETFTPAFFMGKPRASISDKQPIFIVGMPRSGTSLTEQILASHPAVYGAGELLTMNRIMQQLPGILGSNRPFPFCLEHVTEAQLNDVAARYIDHVKGLAGPEKYVSDKLPHNFYALGLIQLLFPGAHVIHCRRNPLDTCLSIYFQQFLEEHDYAKDLFNIGVHYHQYRRLMRHWKQVLSIPVLDVDYEQLVADQEAVTRRMLAFCGLEWDPACLDFHRSSRHVETASYEQVRQPIYSKSIERWKHYEKHLGPLREGLERGY